MRQLRACDFCGDDAAGVYEPLPREVADQRRIALCPDCRDTLEDLLAPLGADEPADDGDGVDEATPESEERGFTDSTRAADINADGPDVAGEGGAERDEDSTADPDEDGAEDGASGNENQSKRAAEPDGFRKVMRLLNNRSFPVERAVAVELASGAYELSDSEVEGVLDYAVERGVLEESGGELHRG